MGTVVLLLSEVVNGSVKSTGISGMIKGKSTSNAEFSSYNLSENPCLLGASANYAEKMGRPVFLEQGQIYILGAFASSAYYPYLIWALPL